MSGSARDARTAASEASPTTGRITGSRGGIASEASETVGTELQFRPLERPVRLSRPRLQMFDYRGQYAYHVVIVTNNRVPVFDDPQLGHWCLGLLREVVDAASFELLAFCLMPDHLHLLTQGTQDSSHLVTFIQRFKRRTGFHFEQKSGSQLWQPSYFDRVLRKEEDLGSVAEYVLQNPVAEGLCARPEDYGLSGGTFAAATPAGPN